MFHVVYTHRNLLLVEHMHTCRYHVNIKFMVWGSKNVSLGAYEMIPFRSAVDVSRLSESMMFYGKTRTDVFQYALMSMNLDRRLPTCYVSRTWKSDIIMLNK